MDQAGGTWRHNAGSIVRGVLIERATGGTLDNFLRDGRAVL